MRLRHPADHLCHELRVPIVPNQGFHATASAAVDHPNGVALRPLACVLRPPGTRIPDDGPRGGGRGYGGLELAVSRNAQPAVLRPAARLRLDGSCCAAFRALRALAAARNHPRQLPRRHAGASPQIADRPKLGGVRYDVSFRARAGLARAVHHSHAGHRHRRRVEWAVCRALPLREEPAGPGRWEHSTESGGSLR